MLCGYLKIAYSPLLDAAFMQQSRLVHGFAFHSFWKHVILLLMYPQKLSRSLTLRHDAYVSHLTSSQHTSSTKRVNVVQLGILRETTIYITVLQSIGIIFFYY